MKVHSRSPFDISRRSILKMGVATGALLATPGFVRSAFAQDKSKTLVIAAPATPLSLDVENSLSLGTIDTVAAFYDYLIGFNTIPDAVEGVMREDLTPDPSKPGGYNLKPMLAESWEYAADGKSVKFTLRKGVLSNWGNELTAEDVKYTFDRKFEVKGAGAFMTSVMGLPGKDAVKVEDKYVVSFTLDNPNPILMIVCGHLANPIFDSTKCKEMATADDPWAKLFLDTNVAGFGPYTLKLALRIASREQSAVETVSEAFVRIAALDGELSAFCTLDEEAALTQAAAVDAKLKDGETVGPLAGVPVAIKDLIATRGLMTTFGSPLYANNVPAEDDVVVERLRQAGAIIVGKTNTSEFGYGPVGHNPLFATTRNPWNAALTPGGSSAGSAAAVAAGMVSLALGSDGGGSIRIPAALTGLYASSPPGAASRFIPGAAMKLHPVPPAGSRSNTSGR
jgi:hypothetical protein